MVLDWNFMSPFDAIKAPKYCFSRLPNKNSCIEKRNQISSHNLQMLFNYSRLAIIQVPRKPKQVVALQKGMAIVICPQLVNLSHLWGQTINLLGLVREPVAVQRLE